MRSLLLLLTIFLRLVESCSWLAGKCLPYLYLSSLPLHFYALHWQSYRNHTKEIWEDFKDRMRLGLAVLKRDCCFWRLQNSGLNLLDITSEESWFLISKIMLLKHVYMGLEFQRTLKLSMFISLKNVFISVAVSTLVASASLKFHTFAFIR